MKVNMFQHLHVENRQAMDDAIGNVYIAKNDLIWQTP